MFPTNLSYLNRNLVKAYWDALKSTIFFASFSLVEMPALDSKSVVTY